MAPVTIPGRPSGTIRAVNAVVLESEMFYLLFLHIGLMFTAVAMHAGPQLLMVVAARTGQFGAMPAIARVWEKSARVISAAFGLGAVFGLATGIAFGYDLLAGWLVAAYVLFIASGAWSNFVTVPYFRKLAAAARLDGRFALADGPGAALAATSTDSSELARLAGWQLGAIVGLDLLFVAALVFDMVVKPFV